MQAEGTGLNYGCGSATLTCKLTPMHEFVTNDDIERMVKQLGFTNINRYHFNVVARK